MNVLFVYVANSGRSVMAERIFRQLAGDHHHARSAGSDPGSVPHPQAVEALQEMRGKIMYWGDAGLHELDSASRIRLVVGAHERVAA